MIKSGSSSTCTSSKPLSTDMSTTVSDDESSPVAPVKRDSIGREMLSISIWLIDISFASSDMNSYLTWRLAIGSALGCALIFCENGVQHGLQLQWSEWFRKKDG